MSLRCSLLGHEYGKNEIEREREERGDEVVITVVELERCVRCGTTRTISENTEVTQLSHPQPEASDTKPHSDASEPKREPAADGDSTGPGIEPRPEVGEVPETGSDAGSDTDPRAEIEPRFDDSADEDTEIIEEDGTDGEDEREPGAWPEVADHEERADESPGAWPSVEGEDEGFDAATPDGSTDVEFGGGLTPQADQGAEIIESTDEVGSAEDEPTFVSADSMPTADRSAVLGGETVLFCPNCDSSALDERDSLRAGDICPACHRGYLAEREP